MDSKTVGDRLKELRNIKKMTQKEFSIFLGIPQPSVSAYENSKNSPTIEVLIDIANKCDVSLDWLSGRTNDHPSITSMQDIVSFFYELSMLNEIGFNIEVEDKFDNDLEDNKNKWNAKIIFYGNNEEKPSNSDVCNILKELSENVFDLDSYSITKEQFDELKSKSIEYYSSPLTQKKFEELSRDEILKRRIEFLKKNNML